MVLHHARRPAAILDELYRVLKPGAALILADLLSADDPVKRATQNAIEEKRNPAHVAARSVDQYRKLVTDAGLTVAGTEVVSFERELEEWLRASSADPANGVVVREMMEAGLETDAAGIHVRRQNGLLVFDQRMLYLRAVRP
jgi:SAM-dependent methyltransferase